MGKNQSELVFFYRTIGVLVTRISEHYVSEKFSNEGMFINPFLCISSNSTLFRWMGQRQNSHSY